MWGALAISFPVPAAFLETFPVTSTPLICTSDTDPDTPLLVTYNVHALVSCTPSIVHSNMPKVGAITVSIVANGTVLHEYNPPNDEQSDSDAQVVKYIEVVENSEFSIRVNLDSQTNWQTEFKMVHIYMDGDYVVGRYIGKETGNYREGWHIDIGKISVFEAGSWFDQSFLFKNLQTTDQSRELDELKKIAQGLGTIRVEIFDVTRDEQVQSNGSTRTETQPVPEKALKGQPIDMSAGFGQKRLGHRILFFTSTKVGSVLANFVFKYRSRRALQLLDLIPATPEPEPLEERDVSVLGAREMRELLTQMRERENRMANELARVKQETLKVKEDGTANRKRQSATVESDDDECIIVEVKKRRKIKEEIDVLDLT